MNESDDDEPVDGLPDSALFRDAMREVEPIRTDYVPPEKPRPKPRARRREADDSAVMAALAGQPAALADRDSSSMDALWQEFAAGDAPEAGDELSFRSEGIQHGVWRAFKRGDYRLDARLDLHGMREAEAREQLRPWLRQAAYLGQRCVLVVHGKGMRSGSAGAVLKRLVDGQLRREKAVLAFASARPVDGGTGAVYVLLRRPKLR